MDEHTSHELAYKKGYEDGKRDGAKMSPTDKDINVPSWIPVTERLPNSFGGYLVVVQIESGAVYTDYADYDPYQKRWRTGTMLYPGEKVILWAELPEPPKGE